MQFNIRYLDISDWIFGERGDRWCPLIPIDALQYALKKQKINRIYSIYNPTYYGSDASNIEDATYLLNKSVYISFRRLMEINWKKWGFTSEIPASYAIEIANEIKTNLINDYWNPWGHIPLEINLLIIRRIHGSKVFWINNAFYIGNDPEAAIDGDVIVL
jgi:hypothetical protein